MQQATTVVSGTLESHTARDTRRIGRALGERATRGALLALIGPLGAGKTELAKGVAEGLGVASVVNSPTFVLMNEHIGRLRLFHVDLYRLEDPEEALAIGLTDQRQAEGVTVVEWADRLADWLPAERLTITLILDPRDADRRHLSWTARGAAHARLAEEALAAS